MDKVISFIQPSRNNLKYLKWSYDSIRKNLGYRHEICWADDFSNDGTWEWMNEMIFLVEVLICLPFQKNIRMGLF